MLVFKRIKSLSLILSFAIAALAVSCNTAENDSTEVTPSQTDSTESKPLEAKAILSGTYADTTLEGTAAFKQENGKVKLDLNITVPAKANQSVAVHLHEHGGCGNMGADAHGHWNPTGKDHGKWGDAAFHSGDIGNVQLDAEGKGSLTMETDLWTIGGDSSTNILQKAVIVHGGVDDYKTQPTGNAGGRIGCGVIQ